MIVRGPETRWRFAFARGRAGHPDSSVGMSRSGETGFLGYRVLPARHDAPPTHCGPSGRPLKRPLERGGAFFLRRHEPEADRQEDNREPCPWRDPGPCQPVAGGSRLAWREHTWRAVHVQKHEGDLRSPLSHSCCMRDYPHRWGITRGINVGAVPPRSSLRNHRSRYPHRRFA
jgi:hypothetical protein